MLDIAEYEKMTKLDLPEKERQLICSRVERLIEGFSELDSILTEDIEPLVTVLDLCNVMRDDKCVKAFTREEILANAPEQYDGCFQVPRTLD